MLYSKFSLVIYFIHSVNVYIFGGARSMLLPIEFQIQPEVFSLHVVLRKLLI